MCHRLVLVKPEGPPWLAGSRLWYGPRLGTVGQFSTDHLSSTHGVPYSLCRADPDIVRRLYPGRGLCPISTIRAGELFDEILTIWNFKTTSWLWCRIVVNCGKHATPSVEFRFVDYQITSISNIDWIVSEYLVQRIIIHHPDCCIWKYRITFCWEWFLEIDLENEYLHKFPDHITQTKFIHWSPIFSFCEILSLAFKLPLKCLSFQGTKISMLQYSGVGLNGYHQIRSVFFF